MNTFWPNDAQKVQLTFKWPFWVKHWCFWLPTRSNARVSNTWLNGAVFLRLLSSVVKWNFNSFFAVPSIKRKDKKIKSIHLFFLFCNFDLICGGLLWRKKSSFSIYLHMVWSPYSQLITLLGQKIYNETQALHIFCMLGNYEPTCIVTIKMATM